jgi:RHS repeat-associated protein
MEMMKKRGLLLGALALALLVSPPLVWAPRGQNTQTPLVPAATPPGQSVTLLPDGSLLLLGGMGKAGPLALAQIKPPKSNKAVTLPTSLNVARAWHTATLLPDGTVLIVGGVDTNGSDVGTVELFDPATEAFRPLPSAGLTARAYHSATLLTDGTVLIAGGASSDGTVLSSAELWDPQTQTATPVPAELNMPRRSQSATLLPDGTVLLWGGTDSGGKALHNGEIYEPGNKTFTLVQTLPAEAQSTSQGPSLAASIPQDGAQGVSLSVQISLRFSERLNVTSVNSNTVTLQDAQGQNVPVTVVPAESGMLAFATPKSPLLPAATYNLSLNGLTDLSNRALSPTQISFTTAGLAASAPAEEPWVPGPTWRTGLPDSSWRQLPPLQAPSGTTAVSGQVLKLDGQPLANVTLQINGFSARSDSTGRFLLTLDSKTSGHCVLVMDGATANRPGASYGLFQYGMNVQAGITNVLPFAIWMPLLDTAHAVTIPSPTTAETDVTSPLLPGLVLRIPPQTAIYDSQWNIVHQITITPIPLDRTPFPLPNVQVPIYFTIQPGGGWIKVLNPNGPKGAQLIYPNTYRSPPGTPYDFWNYNATGQGWYVYGLGTVASNASSIVPNPGVLIYGFTGAMVGSTGAANTNPPPQDPNCTNSPNPSPPNPPLPPNPTAPPSTSPNPLISPNPPNATCGEPIDLSTGLFIYRHTDLALPDVIPLALTRTYRTNDLYPRAFGIGMTHPYDVFLYSPNGDTDIYLILPDGSRIHFTRSGAIWAATPSPTSFYGATLAFNKPTWTLTKKDGTVLTFPESDGTTRPQQAALNGYKDRNGNTLTFTRDSNSNLTEIASPDGRYIQFTLDSSGRIIQATDNLGRVVKYAYNAAGELATVTDANGGITAYTYDSNYNMLTITNPRAIKDVTNQYDSNKRAIQQTRADGSTYRVSYTLDGSGDVTGATVTDPRGYVREVTFNSSEYVLSDTRAVGTPQQQTTTYNRDSDGSNLIQSIVDPLGRTTAYTYDSLGNVASVTQLSGTSSAVKTSFTYSPTFSEIASITDPLGHVTDFTYDATGDLVTLTDPLSHQWTFTYNSQGQPLTATDPLKDTTSFGYSGGDLASVTDPLGRVTTLARDGDGRLIQLRDPTGVVTHYAYDGLDNLTSTTDALGNVTSFAYDPDSNLLTLTDARKSVTSYTYDNLDRISTRKDPLGHSESYTYDLEGNLLTFTDRKGQKTSFTYDPLNRRTKATYADSSSTSYTYDAGNRLTQAVDSISGTITRTYDGLDRLTSEATPQGTVGYAYDNASRRTKITVAGQTSIGYSYDNANRLTQISQGTSNFGFAYDNANRRTTLSFPNGVTTTYGYDNASELTGIAYAHGSTSLGNLAYAYDAGGRRISIGGSYARTGLPPAVASASYNADNQLTQWGSASLSYDLDGNLTNDGTNAYAWNARNQLASINSGKTASFQYDAFSRRVTKNISGFSTSFLYDGVNPVQELAGKAVSANLVTGLSVDERFSRTDSLGARYFLSDALGSTLGLADSTGTVKTEYTYEPFGNTTMTGTLSGNSYQFTGRENDNTGLYYYRARYYSPGLGRFVREDPVRFQGGINLYRYVRDNPLAYRDPRGTQTEGGGTDGGDTYTVVNPPSACNLPYRPPPPPPTPPPPNLGPNHCPNGDCSVWETSEQSRCEELNPNTHCTATGQPVWDAQENPEPEPGEPGGPVWVP